MILFLYGKDTFRSRDHLHKMIDKFKKDRDPSGINVRVLDASKESVPRVAEEMRTLPFLAEKRMLVLEKTLVDKNQAMQEYLVNNLDKVPESTVLIFWDEVIGKSKEVKALLQRLLKEKFVQEFDLLEGVRLEEWINSEVTMRGGKIDRKALTDLVSAVGSDTWSLNSIIDQAIAYDKNISSNTIKYFLPQKFEDNIFTLVDNIVDKNTKNALKLLNDQFAIGNDAAYVLSMLIRQYRIFLEMEDYLNRDGSESTLAQKLEIHPFVAKKSLPYLKRFKSGELNEIYRELLNIDIEMKTGGDARLLLERMIARN